MTLPGGVTRWSPRAIAAAVAALPISVVIGALAEQPFMQRGDYWMVMDRILDSKGHLVASKLMTPQNEHILWVPGLVYWLNLQLFHGRAWTLAIVVYAVVAATIALLVWNAPSAFRRGALGLIVPVILVWLLFSPRGLANLAIPMSGMAWCTANLFALAAVCAISRRRLPLAILLALIATLTYGTGLAAWPAIVAADAIRKWPKPDRYTALTAAIGVVTIVAYARQIPVHAARGDGGIKVPTISHNFLQVLGGIVSEPSMAIALGICLIGAIAWCGWHVGSRYATTGTETSEPVDEALPIAERVDDGRPLFALGMAVYALGAAGLIGLGRDGIQEVGLSGRYASLPALGIIATLFLAAHYFSETPVFTYRSVAIAGFCAVLSFAGSTTAIEQWRTDALDLDGLAIAMKLGSGAGFFGEPNVAELKVAKHIPFDGNAIGDCGRIGTTQPSDNPTVDLVGAVDSVGRGPNPTISTVYGWILPASTPKCLLLVDDSDVVIGAATYGYPRVDAQNAVAADTPNLGFVGYQRAGIDTARLVVVFDDGKYATLSFSPPAQ